MKRFSVILIAIVICIYRLLCSKCSLVGFGSDFAGHTALAEILLKHPDQFFQWPPVYWGMILSHVLSWPFIVLGLDVSRAMLIVFDLSMISVVAALWRMANDLDWGAKTFYVFLLIVVTICGLSAMSTQGFYSQAVSYGFYVPCLVLWIRSDDQSYKQIFLGLTLLGLGALCYPDAFLWIAPLWGWSTFGILKKLNFKKYVFGFFLALSWIAIFLGQISVMKLEGVGGLGFEWILTGLIGLGIFFIIKNHRSENMSMFKLRRGFLVYLFVVLTIGAFSLVSQGKILYYARKNLYSVFYWIPLVAVYLFSLDEAKEGLSRYRSLIWGSCLCIALGWLGFLRFPVPRLMDFVIRARGPISEDDRALDFSLKARSCPDGEKMLVIPSKLSRQNVDDLDLRISRLVYANLKTLQFDVAHSSYCIFGKYVGYIEAGILWKTQFDNLSGSQVCTQQCPPLK